MRAVPAIMSGSLAETFCSVLARPLMARVLHADPSHDVLIHPSRPLRPLQAFCAECCDRKMRDARDGCG
jgi:hypothetical protein